MSMWKLGWDQLWFGSPKPDPAALPRRWPGPPPRTAATPCSASPRPVGNRTPAPRLAAVRSTCRHCPRPADHHLAAPPGRSPRTRAAHPKPLSNVNRTNSATEHSPRPALRPSANPCACPSAPAADPRSHTGNGHSCQAGRTPRPAIWFNAARTGARLSTGRDNGPLSLILAVACRAARPTPPCEPAAVAAARVIWQ
jgi:hypothetical protein